MSLAIPLQLPNSRQKVSMLNAHWQPTGGKGLAPQPQTTVARSSRNAKRYRRYDNP